MPLLMNCLLLIPNVPLRNHIFSYPLVRRVLLSPESVDEWLVHMFNTGGNESNGYDDYVQNNAADMAAEYLVMVTNMPAHEYYGLSSSLEVKLSNHALSFVEERRNEVLRTVGRLKGFLPIIMKLHASQRMPNADDAAEDDFNANAMLLDLFSITSPVVKTVLDEAVQSQFFLAVVFLDATFLLGMILGLRMYVHALHREQNLLLLRPDSKSDDVAVPFFMSLLSISYTALRELFHVFSVYGSLNKPSPTTSWTNFSLFHYLSNFWYVVDIVSV